MTTTRIEVEVYADRAVLVRQRANVVEVLATANRADVPDYTDPEIRRLDWRSRLDVLYERAAEYRMNAFFAEEELE